MLIKTPDNVTVNFQYQLIKLAWLHYQCSPETLSSQVLVKLKYQATVAQDMMNKVLTSHEAKAEQVQAQEVHFIFEQLQSQFDDQRSFELSLKQQGLDEDSLQEAIYHDLICEKTLQTQSEKCAKASEQQVLAYYTKNKDKFIQPERRKVSHILITINDDFAENTRQQAFSKIHDLHRRLQANIAEFPALAEQHSECPTSLQQGLIGDVARGQLYSELDAVLFKLRLNQISAVIETEVGFHLLLCHSIVAKTEVPKELALKQIRSQLNQHRQKKYEKRWLESLLC